MNSELIQIHRCCCSSCFTKKKSDQFASADIKTRQLVPSHANCSKMCINGCKWDEKSHLIKIYQKSQNQFSIWGHRDPE